MVLSLSGETGRATRLRDRRDPGDLIASHPGFERPTPSTCMQYLVLLIPDLSEVLHEKSAQDSGSLFFSESIPTILLLSFKGLLTPCFLHSLFLGA